MVKSVLPIFSSRSFIVSGLALDLWAESILSKFVSLALTTIPRTISVKQNKLNFRPDFLLKQENVSIKNTSAIGLGTEIVLCGWCDLSLFLFVLCPFLPFSK